MKREKEKISGLTESSCEYQYTKSLSWTYSKKT